MPDTVTVAEVYVVDFDQLGYRSAEHTCARCGYAPRPYLEGNLRMDLWSTPVVAAGHDHATDRSGRLILTNTEVTWVALCGSSDDKGWVGSPLPDEGAYGGNGCLTWAEGGKTRCQPLRFPADE